MTGTHRLRLPASDAAALAHRARERDAHHGGDAQADEPAGARSGGAPLAGDRGPQGLRGAPAARALGRHAAACVAGARARVPAAHPADGRALRRSRRDHPRGHAGRVAAAVGAHRHDGGVHHAQHSRSGAVVRENPGPVGSARSRSSRPSTCRSSGRAPKRSAACRASARSPSISATTCAPAARTSKGSSHVERQNVVAGRPGIRLRRVFRVVGAGGAPAARPAGHLARSLRGLREDLGAARPAAGEYLADHRRNRARVCRSRAGGLHPGGRHLLFARRARADLPLSGDGASAAESGVRAVVSHLVRIRHHAQDRDRRTHCVLPDRDQYRKGVGLGGSRALAVHGFARRQDRARSF